MLLIDTHCHLNIIVKEAFDRILTPDEVIRAHQIINAANQANVTILINVGTSLIESQNCITLAQKYPYNYAAIGIHPNDLTPFWADELKTIALLLKNKDSNKIVAVGECGMDFHYPHYDKQRQIDAFKAQIELSLEHDVALIVHTRDAPEETLYVLEEYRKNITRGIIHCFSEDQSFATTVLSWGFAIGLGGTITYPKNTILRTIAQSTPLESIVLETDAPFLPPQSLRGKKNYPENIALIAQYLADLKNISLDEVAHATSKTAARIFKLDITQKEYIL